MKRLILSRSVRYVALVALFCTGCRAIIPVREIRSSSAPDISRVELKNGKVTIFNADLGWYNKRAGTIEGITLDSQHVEYHLSELNKVETVREYSVVPAAVVGAALLGAVIWLASLLLTHARFL